MPRSCTVQESYLTWCKWKIKYPCFSWCSKKVWFIKIYYPCRFRWCTGYIPYPCIKKKDVPGWCYDCSYVRVECYGFWCNYYCCDGGKEYKWTRPAFMMFGTRVEPATLHSSSNELDEVGDCEGYAEPQELPDEGHYVPPGPGPTPNNVVGGAADIVNQDEAEEKAKNKN